MAELAVNLVSEEFVQEIRRALKTPRGGNQPNTERPSTPPQRPDGIRVFNTSSTDTIRGYGIMAVTDATGSIAPDVLNVATPSTTFYRTYLVNGPVSIQPSGWGWAQKGPLVRVAYDSGTPANGEGWGPKPSQDTVAQFYPEICKIQGVYDSTAKIALAFFSPTLDSGFGKADGTIANASTGTISIWRGTFTADISGWDVTMTNEGPSVSSGDSVTWEYKNGKPCFTKLCS